MEAIQGIQEIIDEHKEQMYDKSKEAIENFPKLYKLTWTMVDSHAHVVEVEDGPSFANVKLSHKTQTFIVEQVDRDEGRVVRTGGEAGDLLEGEPRGIGEPGGLGQDLVQRLHPRDRDE